MRVKSVRVQNFRSIEDLEVALDPFTALVGANGSGKSAILHALNWFFTGARGDDFDFRVLSDGSSVDSFSVTVRIFDLDEATTAQWAKYIRNGELELRRIASRAAADKLAGLSRQGPGFNDIRQATDTTQRRSLYREARQLQSGLPSATSKVDIEAALDAWESDPANEGGLTEVPDSDLAFAFGFNGKNLLGDVLPFVLVPASTRLEDNVDPAGKGGAIDQLLGAVVRMAADAEIASWVSTHSDDLSELGSKISSAVGNASVSHMNATNKYLGEMIHGAEVTLKTSARAPKIQPQIDVMAEFKFNGPPLPISNQGHGVQRSVMMSTLQAAPDSKSTESSIFLAVEEPELYQHPARSIALARSLKRLTAAGRWQVLVATHSPSFLGTQAAASLRRFSKESNDVSVVEGSVSKFSALLGKPIEAFQKHLETLLPGEFANAYFADRAFLVEGITDQIVLGRVLELHGFDVDANNWTFVNCEGKGNLPFAAAILKQLGVDTRVIFDADHRENADDPKHKKSTDSLLSDLRKIGLVAADETFAFGDASTCLSAVAILNSDLEAEQAAWGSYIATIRDMTGGVKCKNPYIVRQAAASAKLDDCPKFLRDLCAMLTQ